MEDNRLLKVRNDQRSGHLGRARDRLHGLVSTWPDELEFRRELGAAYFALGDKVMAGCYWYLHESDFEEMDDAKRAFASFHGGDAIQMLGAVKFKGDFRSMPSGFAKDRLKDLRIAYAKRQTALAEKSSPSKAINNIDSRRSQVLDTISLFATAILIVVGIPLIFAIIGFGFEFLNRLFTGPAGW